MNFETIEFTYGDMGLRMKPNETLEDIDANYLIQSLPDINIYLGRDHDHLEITVTGKENEPLDRNLLNQGKFNRGVDFRTLKQFYFSDLSLLATVIPNLPDDILRKTIIELINNLLESRGKI